MSLTPKQMQAVLLLVEPSIHSYPEYAAMLGVSDRTLRRWRAMPEFEELIETMFQARLDAAIYGYVKDKHRPRVSGKLQKAPGNTGA